MSLKHVSKRLATGRESWAPDHGTKVKARGGLTGKAFRAKVKKAKRLARELAARMGSQL